MVEGPVHEEIRKRIIDAIDEDKFEVYSSHNPKTGTLPTYIGAPHSHTQMADVDLAIAKKSHPTQVKFIIEIEDKLPPPKYLIGEIMAIAISDKITLERNNKPVDLKGVELVVAHEPQKPGSHKMEQYPLIEKRITQLIGKQRCIIKVQIIDWEQFMIGDPLHIFKKEAKKDNSHEL